MDLSYCKIQIVLSFRLNPCFISITKQICLVVFWIFFETELIFCLFVRMDLIAYSFFLFINCKFFRSLKEVSKPDKASAIKSEGEM